MFVQNANAILVHVSCDHSSERIDRFGDRVCRKCGEGIK